MSLIRNTFEKNKASNKGGALLWVNQNFITHDSSEEGASADEDSNVYIENAALYGSDSGSYPRKLRFIV